MKLFEAAITDFNIVIELNPNDVDAYYSRGYALYYLGQYQRALEDFDKAIWLNPDDPYSYWSRGLPHRKLGHIEEALADFRYYLELRPDAENREKFEQWIAELEAQLDEN
jgi:tetratricopeptide (TPR) repeat protein